MAKVALEKELAKRNAPGITITMYLLLYLGR